MELFRRLGREGAAIGILAVFLSGCGGVHSALPQQQALPAIGPAALEGTPPNIAGTYKGTFTETSGSHSLSGTATIVVKQNVNALSGTWAFTAKGHTSKGSFAGTVRAAKVGARVKFTFQNPHGRNASGHARVRHGHLNGSATAPRVGTLEPVSIKVTTTKT